jgi:hypothetical protein
MPWFEMIERFWPVIVIAGFCLGFIVARLYWRNKNRGLNEELEAVRQRSQNAERRISRQLSSWVKPDGELGRAVLRAEPGAGSDLETGVADAGGDLEGNWFSMVRLTKVQGREDSSFKIGDSVVGYDEHLPEVGKPYRLLFRDGKVLATSEVTEVESGLIHTRNSVYRIEFLQEEKSEDEK